MNRINQKGMDLLGYKSDCRGIANVLGRTC